MQVHTLRVKKSVVGPKFPFDRVYAVKYEDRGQIEQLFRCALVMPLDTKLLNMLLDLEVDDVVARPFERDDEATQGRKAKENELEHALGKDEWVLVVPILPKWLRGRNLAVPESDENGNGQQAPRYITSPKWFAGKKRHERHTNEPFLPNLAYLQVPGRKVRPVCVACPRRIMQENSECHLGQAECYTHLALGVKNYFKAGAEAPQSNTDEVLQMLEDDFVPADVP